MTVSSGATNAVQVRLGVSGEVEVDDHVDALDVDTAREQVGAHKIAAVAHAEVVEHAVPVSLLEFRVDVVARVAEFCDLLREQLHALCCVAEDDRLVDLKLHPVRDEPNAKKESRKRKKAYVFAKRVCLPGWRECSGSELCAFPAHMRSTA